jgi:hypothetical protein
VTGDVQRLPVASLRRDGGTQVRAEVSAATVDNYREAMAEGAAFPPVVAFFDGVDHWLADGFHRVMAAESAGLADVLTEVREGTRRDALRYALGANRKHGLPMSGPDKRRAIGLLLADDEWRGMSDRAIAAEIGVSDKTVASVRREMAEATAENPQLDTPRTGRDGKVRRQRTAPAPAVEPVQVEPAVEPAAPAPQEQPEAPAIEPDAAVQPAHETANDAAPVEPAADPAEVESLRARLIEAERALAEARAEATSLRAAPVETPAPAADPAEVESLRVRIAELERALEDTRGVVKSELDKSSRLQRVLDAATAELMQALEDAEAQRKWLENIPDQPWTDKEPNLDRIMKLIVLAGSPNENEARNAAFLACKAIREHRLQLMDLGGIYGKKLEESTRELMDAVIRRAAEQRQREAEAEAAAKAKGKRRAR